MIRASCGLYLLIFADNHAGPTSGFGFGWSKDGVDWEKNSGSGLDSGLEDYVLAPAPRPHRSVRTPLALVEHRHRPGFFTLFFTAFEQQHNGTSYIHPPNIPHEQYEAMYASELELVLSSHSDASPAAKSDDEAVPAGKSDSCPCSPASLCQSLPADTPRPKHEVFACKSHSLLAPVQSR